MAPVHAKGRGTGPSRKERVRSYAKRAHALDTKEIEECERRLKEDAEARAAEGAQASESFADLPISTKTRQGLKEANYTTMTPIQTEAIPLALQGKDLLAAAPTGSGKTLAFLVPALELLWRQRWIGPSAGLGVLVLAPTRELALQIFEVLRKVGRKHSFSAGLVIGGGTELDVERDRISGINMLVATPGRLLQHLDQSIAFDPLGLRILVLDEADRILDLGFEKTLSAILEHLKPTRFERQTMLFSATQTRSIKALARLSLNNPEYVAVGSSAMPLVSNAPEASWAIPDGLQQSYMIAPAEDKLTLMWWFIKIHLKTKTLVFLSSCKQVRFIYEVFRRMRPGTSLLHIHGRMKQAQRLAMYNQFCQHKNAFLFATDVAARGLDFPAIDWVVQLDCPDSIESYVHRAGRTARYKSVGSCLLVLLPSEACFAQKLSSATSTTLKRTKPNKAKVQSITLKVASIAAESPEVKYLGQRSLETYVRSLALRQTPDLFGDNSIDMDKLAESLGLPSVPMARDLRRLVKKRKQNVFGYDNPQVGGPVSEVQRNDTESSHVQDEHDDDENEEDILTVKKRHMPETAVDDDNERRNPPKRLKICRSGQMRGAVGRRTVFDDEDEDNGKDEDDKPDSRIGHSEVNQYVDKVGKKLARIDREDKAREKERLREKRRRTKERRPGGDEAEVVVDNPVDGGASSCSSDDPDPTTDEGVERIEDREGRDDDYIANEELALKILESRE